MYVSSTMQILSDVKRCSSIAFANISRIVKQQLQGAAEKPDGFQNEITQ
jgi:hypothetical protein